MAQPKICPQNHFIRQKKMLSLEQQVSQTAPNHFITNMSQKELNKEEYISLTEATKYCNYSQEYLSLRARQGKLKAEKIGRNWTTKKEWVEEYFGKTNSEKARVQEKRTNGFSFSYDKYFSAVTVAFGEIGKIIKKLKIIFFKPELRYAVASILVFIFVFLGAGCVFDSARNNDIANIKYGIGYTGRMVNEYTQWLDQTIIRIPARAVAQNISITLASVSGAGESFYNKYVAANNWVEDKIQKIAMIPFRLSNMFFNLVSSDTEIKTKLVDKEIEQEFEELIR